MAGLAACDDRLLRLQVQLCLGRHPAMTDDTLCLEDGKYI